MRKVLLALLFVPLFTASVREPTHNIAEPRPPSAFPFTFDRTLAGPTLPSALLFPLGDETSDVQLTSREDGVRFDIDGDSLKEQVAWPRAGAEIGFLAIDVNDDGRITSGKELFGSATFPDARNGAQALLRMFEQ